MDDFIVQKENEQEDNQVFVVEDHFISIVDHNLVQIDVLLKENFVKDDVEEGKIYVVHDCRIKATIGVHVYKEIVYKGT